MAVVMGAGILEMLKYRRLAIELIHIAFWTTLVWGTFKGGALAWISIVCFAGVVVLKSMCKICPLTLLEIEAQTEVDDDHPHPSRITRSIIKFLNLSNAQTNNGFYICGGLIGVILLWRCCTSQ
jgi:hypothetical protein